MSCRIKSNKYFPQKSTPSEIKLIFQSYIHIFEPKFWFEIQLQTLAFRPACENGCIVRLVRFVSIVWIVSIVCNVSIVRLVYIVRFVSIVRLISSFIAVYSIIQHYPSWHQSQFSECRNIHAFVFMTFTHEVYPQKLHTYLKAETHDATRRGDKSPRLHCCCDKSFALSLLLRYVAQIQTSLNLCDRLQQQNSVAATMIFTCHTRRFVEATCRGDVSQRFVASCVSLCVSALTVWLSLGTTLAH